MLAVDEHRPTLALTCERIKRGVTVRAEGGRQEGRGACRSQGCWGEGCCSDDAGRGTPAQSCTPWLAHGGGRAIRGGTANSFDVAQSPSTRHRFNAEIIWAGSFTYATTTHARDLQDFSISPSLGNPPKLILEPLEGLACFTPPSKAANCS